MTVLLSDAEAKELLETLELPAQAHRLLTDPRFWHEAVCRHLFEICEDLIFTVPQEGLKLAIFVPRLVDRISPEHCHGGRIKALKGSALCIYGESLRAAGDIQGADDAYLLAEFFFEQEGTVLDFAGLRLRRSYTLTARRLFPRALKEINAAIHARRTLSDDRHSLGHALLVRAFIFGQANQPGNALRELGAALTHLQPERSHRLYYSAIHNLAAALMRGAGSQEDLAAAVEQIQNARHMGKYDAKSLPDIKLRWIEGPNRGEARTS